MSGNQAPTGGNKGKGKAKDSSPRHALPRRPEPARRPEANEGSHSSPSGYVVSRRRVDDDDAVHSGDSTSSAGSPKAKAKEGDKGKATVKKETNQGSTSYSGHYDALSPKSAKAEKILQKDKLSKDAVSEADMKTGTWRRKDAKDPDGSGRV